MGDNKQPICFNRLLAIVTRHPRLMYPGNRPEMAVGAFEAIARVRETPPAQTRIGEAGTALAVQEGGVPLTVVLNYSHGERELYRSVEG